MSLRRSSRSDGILAVTVVVLLAVAAWVLNNRAELLRQRAQEPTVTVGEPVHVDDAVYEPDEDRPVVNVVLRPARPTPAMGTARGRGPLTFAGPDGVIVIRWETNWDQVDAECMRKLWALRSREGAPLLPEPLNFPRYRDDRHGAAWKACPEFRR